MGDITTLTQLSLVAAYVMPGLIALFVRSQFLTGRFDASKENIISFIVISLIWSGLTAPLMVWLNATDSSFWYQSIIWVFLGNSRPGYHRHNNWA